MLAVFLAAGAPERLAKKHIIVFVRVEWIGDEIEFFSRLLNVPCATEGELFFIYDFFYGNGCWRFVMHRSCYLTIETIAVGLSLRNDVGVVEAKGAGDGGDLLEDFGWEGIEIGLLGIVGHSGVNASVGEGKAECIGALERVFNGQGFS